MRGKVGGEGEGKDRVRITPAYAGKSCLCLLHDLGSRDHPRLCGEKFRFLEISPAHEGSPPPMRGKAHKSSGTAFLIRITPAYAGKRQAA